MRQLMAGLLLTVTMSWAQEFRATISGRVADAQEAVVPGAKVTALQVGTGAKFETVSAADGSYTIPFLPPATYRLTAELTGFKRYVRENLAAGANQRLGIDIQMEVGAVTDQMASWVALLVAEFEESAGVS